MKEKMILDESNIANAIFKNLSADEIRKIKGVSHAFYDRATEYLTGHLENENFHLNRVVPPSDAIQREQKLNFVPNPCKHLFVVYLKEKRVRLSNCINLII